MLRRIQKSENHFCLSKSLTKNANQIAGRAKIRDKNKAVWTAIYDILPQAFIDILPEMGHNFLTNLKMTSVRKGIGVSELFLTTKTGGGRCYR